MKMEKRIVVTGGTGNTGLMVLKKIRILKPNVPILALVRTTTKTTDLNALDISYHVCDLNQSDTFINQIKGNDLFLEMANLRHARHILPVLVQAGIDRAFFVTTTGVFSKHHSYSALYREIEEEMRQSPLKATILRPSMIYGNERDHNMHKLLRLINKFPLYPVFGKGQALMQPVHVDDLAEGIAQAVIRDAHGEFNLAGPQALPYRQIVDQAFKASGRKGHLLFIPVKPVAALAGLLQKIPKFPVTKEQVVRLQEDKAFDISDSQKHLDYAPRPFAIGIAQEVERLRQMGQL